MIKRPDEEHLPPDDEEPEGTEEEVPPVVGPEEPKD